jgi:hypothetical protein
MMDLLGAGNPYIRRYAEGGEAQTYSLAQSQWVPGRYRDTEIESRPELGMTLAELQARDPFYSSPGYLDLRKQLADVMVNTQRERDLYAQRVNPLEEQYRQLAGISIDALPEQRSSELRALAEQNLFSQFLAQNKEDVERSKGLAGFFGDVAQRLSGFLETAKPGDAVSIPRNPYVGSSQQFTGAYVLEDPSNPYTYEQRKAFAERGWSVADRGTIASFLEQEVLPKQQYWGDYAKQVVSPEAFKQRSGSAVDDFVAQELAQELEAYRASEQQRIKQEQDRIRREQEQLRGYIIPLVDKGSQEEERLFWEMQNLRKAANYQRPVSIPQADVLVPSVSPPSVPVGEGGGGVSEPSVSPLPSMPSSTPVPVPTLPVYTTPAVSQPQVPVSNLTPQPAGGVSGVPSTVSSLNRGIPRPGIGESVLPQYQSPMAPVSQSAQQSQPQIQYGPIGQAATSSSDLLKNLLASTQQSMPFDFSANNPYLMKQEPVQFFAEGGDVQSGSISNPSGQFASDFPEEYRKNQERAYQNALSGFIANVAGDFDRADEFVKSTIASSGDEAYARNYAYGNAEKNFYTFLNAYQKSLGRYGLTIPEQLRTVEGFKEVFGPGFSYELKDAGRQYEEEAKRLEQQWLASTQGLSNWARFGGPPQPEGNPMWDLMTQRLGTYQPKPPPPTLVPSVPETSTASMPAPAPAPIPVSPVPSPVLPTPAPAAPIMGGNLTPQPLPGITPPAPLPATGIPQPSMSIPRPMLNTGVLPQYQSPTSQAAPTMQQQQPQQQQIQYGPIGQGAVGQTNLLSTLLSQQQDPTQVSLLGFDNPYLMKPFG